MPSPKKYEIREEARLTASEVNTGVVSAADYNTATLLIAYRTEFAGSSLYIYPEVCYDDAKVVWFRLTTSSISSGVDTRSEHIVKIPGTLSSKQYRRAVNIPVNVKYIRFAVKEVDYGAAFGLCSIDAVVGRDK